MLRTEFESGFVQRADDITHFQPAPNPDSFSIRVDRHRFQATEINGQTILESSERLTIAMPTTSRQKRDVVSSRNLDLGVISQRQTS